MIYFRKMGSKNNIVLFLTLLCVSWSGQEDSDPVPSETPPPPIPDQDRIALAVNEFGYKLMIEMMKQNISDNVVISPTSVAGLLAMTLLGSIGGAYDELARSLGFSQDILMNRKNHEQFGELLQQLNTNDTSPPSRTLFADAIFVDAHTQIRDIFHDYLKRVYRGDAITAQFGDKLKAKELINDWVKNHTNGKIEEFLLHPLPSSTKVVLLSALYFSGQWAQPFVPELTRKMPFNTTTKEVLHDLMANFGNFKYTVSTHHALHIIALPYKDNTTTMYVLKPIFPKRLSLPDLMGSLDYEKIDDLIKQMKNQQCVIRFPKMELKSKVDLKETLKALDVKSIFSPTEANFGLMIDNDNKVLNSTEDEIITRLNSDDEVESRGLKDLVNSLPNPGVYVDSVLHDVKITIDEFGTEAVAASSATLARTARLFYADSPFYMFIRNERTGLVTFSAAIFDPTVE